MKDSEIVQKYNQKLREWYDRAIKGKEIQLIEDQNLEYPIVTKIEINDGTGNFYVRCNCEEGKTVNMELVKTFKWIPDNDPSLYIERPKRRPKFRAAKFNKVYDCGINQDGRIPNNKNIYIENLKSNIGNPNEGDIFVAAYGQSGSGKSYLIMGDEKQPQGEKGLIEQTINDIMKSRNDVDKVLFLPLQIYMGHVYNAFIGPNNKDDILKFYRGQVDIDGKPTDPSTYFNENYYRLIDWNYDDIEKRYPNKDKGYYTYQHYTTNKDENDKKNNRYPPVDDILNTYFNDPVKTIENIDGKDRMSLLIPKENAIEEITDIIKNKIKRPVSKPDTNLNEVSSRSHLFNIIRIVFQDGTQRTLTFVDLGGLEPPISVPIQEPGKPTIILTPEQVFQRNERKKLVSHDLTAFRKMFQFYTNHTSRIEVNKKKYQNSSNDIIGGVNSIINSTIFQSSAIFNLVRATSGIFSNKLCTHYIFCLFHKFFKTKNFYDNNQHLTKQNEEYIMCNTTNTVLNSVRGIIP